MTAMSPKLAELMLDSKNCNGSKINKFNNIGQNGDELENMVVLDS
jgi:hypothetical protein